MPLAVLKSFLLPSHLDNQTNPAFCDQISFLKNFFLQISTARSTPTHLEKSSLQPSLSFLRIVIQSIIYFQSHSFYHSPSVHLGNESYQNQITIPNTFTRSFRSSREDLERRQGLGGIPSFLDSLLGPGDDDPTTTTTVSIQRMIDY